MFLRLPPLLMTICGIQVFRQHARLLRAARRTPLSALRLRVAAVLVQVTWGVVRCWLLIISMLVLTLFARRPARFLRQVVPVTNLTTVQLDSVVPRNPACAAPVAGDAEPRFSFAELAWEFGIDDIRRLLLGSVKFLALCELLMLCSAETSSWFLCRDCSTTCKTDSDLLCFTDGSFTAAGKVTPALMGWAVAFFQSKRDSAESLECLGVAAGQVPTCMCETPMLVLSLPSAVRCPWQLW